MGKSEYCTYCLDFYRAKHSSNWGSSKRIVEILGPCSKCQERHEQEINKVKAELTSQRIGFDMDKKSYERNLANLMEESTLDLLSQKAEYEQLLAKSKRQLNFEVNSHEADNNSQLAKIEFLKVRRDYKRGDVILAISDSLTLFAHRAILVAKSPVFQKFLQTESSGTEAKGRSVIKIDGISPPVIEAIVDFCYVGEISFSELVPPDEVLKVANTLQIGFLRELCEAELCRGLNVDNVPQMLKLARDHAAPKLQEEAGKLFREHFDILNNKVYEVLEGPRMTTSVFQFISESSPELEDQLTCLNP